jgi:Asp/Glu/hydantoin racemase
MRSAERLVLIHTVAPLVSVFDSLGTALLPQVQMMHLLDEPLLERVRRRGRLDPEDSARLVDHVSVAEQIGARAVLVTCSTISPSVDEVRPKVDIPVIKIDEAMIAEAVSKGPKIGVVATANTTLDPTRLLLEAEARTAGRTIEVEMVLVDEALEALLAGDGVTHDRLVKIATLEVAQRADVVVLAQASMARVLDVLADTERTAPILSSPHLALMQIRRVLAID